MLAPCSDMYCAPWLSSTWITQQCWCCLPNLPLFCVKRNQLSLPSTLYTAVKSRADPLIHVHISYFAGATAACLQVQGSDDEPSDSEAAAHDYLLPFLPPGMAPWLCSTWVTQQC